MSKPSTVSIAIEGSEPLDQAETCYVNVRLPSLQLTIQNEAGTRLARMIGDSETLPNILEDAIGVAVTEGDWDGLVVLRECLLKYAEEAASALQEQDLGDLWVAA